MRNKILILLLLVSSYCFGQAVPNNEVFSLQDVYNAVDNHTPATTENLQSCFDNAISGYFNPTYNQDSYAPANSMLRFRDYKPNGSCSYPMQAFYNRIESTCGNYDITNTTTLNQACYDMFNCSSSNLILYLNVKVESITVGKQIYDGTICTIQLTFSGYFIVSDSFNSIYKVHVTSGVIDSVATCP